MVITWHRTKLFFYDVLHNGHLHELAQYEVFLSNQKFPKKKTSMVMVCLNICVRLMRDHMCVWRHHLACHSFVAIDVRPPFVARSDATLNEKRPRVTMAMTMTTLNEDVSSKCQAAGPEGMSDRGHDPSKKLRKSGRKMSAVGSRETQKTLYHDSVSRCVTNRK